MSTLIVWQVWKPWRSKPLSDREPGLGLATCSHQIAGILFLRSASAAMIAVREALEHNLLPENRQNGTKFLEAETYESADYCNAPTVPVNNEADDASHLQYRPLNDHHTTLRNDRDCLANLNSTRDKVLYLLKEKKKGVGGPLEQLVHCNRTLKVCWPMAVTEGGSHQNLISIFRITTPSLS